MTELTHDLLSEYLDYDQENGVFSWSKSTTSSVRRGDKAGSLNKSGYVLIQVLNRRYLAHRLAWFYVHGGWPKSHLDHINGDKSDNRISNLREATYAENAQNIKFSKRNKSGYRGVHWHISAKKWVAQIRAYGVSRHIGSFDTAEEAGRAYLEEKKRVHEFQPVPRDY